VKLEGDRNEIHVTFFIPRSLFKQLPGGVVVNQGIRVIPILFNRGIYYTLKMVWELIL
jgi:hypothetical protein